MLVSIVQKYNGKEAFHIYLNVDKNGENILLATIPLTLINKLFPNTLATIRYAHIPSQQACEKYLDLLAEKIFKSKILQAHFYRDFVLEDGIASEETVEQILMLQEIIHFYPCDFFTERIDYLKFFVLNQTFMRKKRHILKTARYITRAEFEYNYIYNKDLATEFERILEPEFLYLELSQESGVEYVLVLSGEELKMFISV
jgi:hypothetical protein